MEVLAGLLIYVRSSRNSMMQYLELRPISGSRFAWVIEEMDIEKDRVRIWRWI